MNKNLTQKPDLSFWKLWNLSFGFFGVQIAYALQSGNISRIFRTLGADPHSLSFFWILPPLMGILVQPIVGTLSDKTWTRLGRRIPYLFVGAALAVAVMCLLPNSGSFGMSVSTALIFGLFALMLPVNYGGVSVTPWAMYGVQGRNAHNFDDYRTTNFVDGAPAVTLSPYLNAMGGGGGLNVTDYGRTSKAYGGMFWAGLPVKIKTFDPWNIEFDVNYGWVESMGRFDVKTRNDDSDIRRGSSKREGWLAKALVEYKMDWGTPGIFGWYGSGDDGSVKNGSERMPSVCPYVWMTSFMGDGNLAWGPNGDYLDLNDSMAGTWGIGFQLSDMSFVDKLTHTFRVAYWGGTNSPSMVKYMDSAYAWQSTSNLFEGPYLTTNDGLLEFNLVNVYQMYENFNINLELGYVANFMDNDTWKKDYNNFGSYEKQDIWKAQLIFTYKF